MGDRGLWKKNDEYSFPILVFEVDGVTPKTGLVNGDFTKRLMIDFMNAPAPVVTEIDSVTWPGFYKVVFTPATNAHYVAYVSHATYYPQGWLDEIQVYERDLNDLAFPLTTGRGSLIGVAGHAGVDTFAPGAIDATAIAANAITTAKIADGAITAAKLADGLFTAAKFAANVFTSATFAAGSFTSATFAAGAVTAAAVADGFLTAVKFAASACDKFADHFKRRTSSNVEGSAYGDALSIKSAYGADACVAHRREVSIDGTELTVFKSDGVTELHVFGLTSDANAAPITAADPGV